jgi:hypothetical protein
MLALSNPTWSEPGFINSDQREVSACEEAAHMRGLCGRHNCGHHHTRRLQGSAHEIYAKIRRSVTKFRHEQNKKNNDSTTLWLEGTQE